MTPGTHDTNPLDDGAHVVHFYETEDGLVSTIGNYLSVAARDGHALVLIATPAHRRHFAATMMRDGIDVPRLIGEGRIALLDAADTIAAISRAGVVDQELFESVVGAALQGASDAAPGQPVHAYGEMVAVMWASGDVNGAVRLEGLWNQLARHSSFSLFCAYPQHLFLDLAAAERFGDVCSTHSSVLRGAMVPIDADAVRHFPASMAAPRLARRFAAETLAQWGVSSHETALVVSELATNAALYGSTEFVVALSRREGVVRVIVTDPDPSPLEPRPPSTPFGGRGLQLVAALGEAWGHETTPVGKCVWADLRVAGI